MAAVAVILIILGCIAYQYLNATLVKAFATLIAAVCASVVAFAYFELLANVLISRNKLIPWAQPLAFVLLFIVAFGVLQTIASQLTRRSVDLGVVPERAGRILCSILLGLLISGVLLTAVAMTPIPTKYPYQRFDAASPNAETPAKALFNADGFATGWFGILSSGSFSGKTSFATVHPGFVDQLTLNRHNISDGISIITTSPAIEVPKKNAVWPAPEDLKDSDGKSVLQKSGHNITIARIGIRKTAIKDAGTFTLSQLRLVAKSKSDAKDKFAGKGINVYPIGYLKTANQLTVKQLNDQIKIERGDFPGKVRWIDFAFHIPSGFAPVLVEFKLNNIAELPPPVTYEQAPLAEPFIQMSECATDVAQLQPITSAKIYGAELATLSKLLSGSKLDVSDPNQWQALQTQGSQKPAQFDEGRISCVQAELILQKPAEEDEAPARRARRQVQPFSKMLKPLDGYRLFSLKCNNPSTGLPINADQLPTLVELSGL
ncbi:MAG: CvpA family protein, partial [Planctomycetota bacterium]